MLAPTRELAQQIEKVMRALGDYLQVGCWPGCGGCAPKLGCMPRACTLRAHGLVHGFRIASGAATGTGTAAGGMLEQL